MRYVFIKLGSPEGAPMKMLTVQQRTPHGRQECNYSRWGGGRGFDFSGACDEFR